MMRADVHGRVLFSREDIARRVREVAAAIALGPLRPEIAVPILTGAFVFAADLLRALSDEGLDLETEFIWLRSYGQAETPGNVTVLKGPGDIVRGRTVLLIDGVLDRGATLSRAKMLLQEAGAEAIVSVVAVVKACPGRQFTADHALFKAGSDFLFGYGMDRAGLGRGLKDIWASQKQ